MSTSVGAPLASLLDGRQMHGRETVSIGVEF
jgi:hypothetical protein